MSEKNIKPEQSKSKVQNLSGDIVGQPDSPATVMPEPGEDAVFPTLPYTPGTPTPEPAPGFDPDASLEISADGKTFKGSKSSQRFPIANKNSVVVRQVQVQSLNGGMVEVPNTETIQTYDPIIYQKMVDDNFFTDSKLKVEVLHQPAAK